MVAHKGRSKYNLVIFARSKNKLYNWNGDCAEI